MLVAGEGGGDDNPPAGHHGSAAGAGGELPDRQGAVGADPSQLDAICADGGEGVLGWVGGGDTGYVGDTLGQRVGEELVGGQAGGAVGPDHEIDTGQCRVRGPQRRAGIGLCPGLGHDQGQGGGHRAGGDEDPAGRAGHGGRAQAPGGG